MSAKCVSVMMACLDDARHLANSIESVLSEPECLELLVADGGSVDGSLEYLEAISKSDSRVRIVSYVDSGKADALNKAFQCAQGVLISWLNPGDLYAKGALKAAIDSLDKHPEWLMVYGEAEYIDNDGELVNLYPSEPPRIGINGFKNKCFVCQSTVVYRRILGVLMGNLNTQQNSAIDLDYWLRIFSKAPERIGFIERIQSYPRSHDDDMRNKKRQDKFHESLQLINRNVGKVSGQWLLAAGEDLLAANSSQLEMQQLIDNCEGLIESQEYNKIKEKLMESQKESVNISKISFGMPKARSLLKFLRKELINKFEESGNPEEEYWKFMLNCGAKEYPYLPYEKTLNQEFIKYIEQAKDTKLTSRMQLEAAKPIGSIPFLERPFGVNLIGYAQGELGIGEDLRCTADALKKASVPITIINFPPGKEISQNDHSLTDELCNEGHYAFNLFCLTAEEIARYLMERGPSQFEQRFNIGYCPWELSKWPRPWLSLLGLVNEFWASSKHTLGAMQHGIAVSEINSQNRRLTTSLMPLSVTLPDLGSIHKDTIRKKYGLPCEAIIFTFSFDLNSSIHRKNPRAALRAFQNAFPTDHHLSKRVALLIKTHAPLNYNHEWALLKAEAARDARLHILEETLNRLDLLRLYAACDGFISLHRTEGYGRGIAEALMLGLDVITTNYGGNCDFCKPDDYCHPVKYKLIPVKNGEYCYNNGQVWARPSTKHASRELQKVAERRVSKKKHGRESIDNYRQIFSPQKCGLNYKLRLNTLWEQRTELEELITHID